MILYKGVGVKKIDPLSKTILDEQDKTHNYDILILGMGSRAFMPKDVPTHLTGILNMRTKLDADNLLKSIADSKFQDVAQNTHHSSLITHHSVVMVGGGLLGIEMAASLRDLGVKVSIVQRISRFMNRQLDDLASSLLHEEIVERGIEVFYNDQVDSFFGKDKIEAVRLRSGRKIECDAVIYAIGTVPNSDLAREAGLDCNRGVKVNDYMQTSDPSVFALGEIAEWQGQMCRPWESKLRPDRLHPSRVRPASRSPRRLTYARLSDHRAI